MTRLITPNNRRASASRTRLGLDTLDDRIVPAAIDLTAAGSVGSHDGVFFKQSDAQPTGTGHIDSFLRIQSAHSMGEPQQGYNTDARPLEFDENKSPNFTRALPLSEIPEVNVGGTVYREFLLDINQKSSQPLLTLDQLRFYTGGAGDIHGYDEATKELAGQSPVFDLDANEDASILLDYRLNSGSGSGDMLMYVPSHLFGNSDFVYLFSRFGETHAGNAGFQEWAVGEGALTVTANIAGTVFLDINKDSFRDSTEQLLPNRIVFIDSNGNETLDDDIEAYTITSAQGTFLFENVAVGEEYTLWTIPEGIESTTEVKAIPIAGETVFVDIPVTIPFN